MLHPVRAMRMGTKKLQSLVVTILLTFGISGLLSSRSALGDVIVDVQDNDITAGMPGFVDVFIDITGGDNLGFASYDFVISNVAAPNSTLRFTGVEGDGDLNYVFFGDNVELFETLLTDSQVIYDDSIDLGAGVTGTGKLLVRLNLESVLGPGGAAAAVGDQFRITLQDSDDTLFQDDTFVGDLTVDASSFDPLVGGGLVTVTAVPEPSSLVFLCIGGTAVAMSRRRSRRRKNVESVDALPARV